jgi:predicted nucleotidyltransferase
MGKKDALGEKLTHLLEYFTGNPAINTVYLFGSFGTEASHAHSDLDMAILFGQEVALLDELKVSADLSLILCREDVDVVNLNKARVDLQHEILSTGEIIYERDRIATADFTENTLRNYFDFGITLRRIRDEFWGRLREEAFRSD